MVARQRLSEGYENVLGRQTRDDDCYDFNTHNTHKTHPSSQALRQALVTLHLHSCE
jgi:hypothetical protein